MAVAHIGHFFLLPSITNKNFNLNNSNDWVNLYWALTMYLPGPIEISSFIAPVLQMKKQKHRKTIQWAYHLIVC